MCTVLASMLIPVVSSEFVKQPYDVILLIHCWSCLLQVRFGHGHMCLLVQICNCCDYCSPQYKKVLLECTLVIVDIINAVPSRIKLGSRVDISFHHSVWHAHITIMHDQTCGPNHAYFCRKTPLKWAWHCLKACLHFSKGKLNILSGTTFLPGSRWLFSNQSQVGAVSPWLSGNRVGKSQSSVQTIAEWTHPQPELEQCLRTSHTWWGKNCQPTTPAMVRTNSE